ncbi:MAG: tRNA 2-thiocytidine(32) synthetase TtcA [Desulfuromonadaceae bacterium]
MPKKDSTFKTIQRLAGKAIGDFNMLENGDRVLVALSGGKDSWSMLHALVRLERKAPIELELIPATIHPGFKTFECNSLHSAVSDLGLELHIEKTIIAEIIQKHRRPGSSYCAFCARLRRGALYTLAQRLECNKVALGHHLDDFIETLLLNQFFSGKLAGMSPNLRADNGLQRVIRPLVYVEEYQITRWAETMDIPIISCGCPQNAQLDQNRQRIKSLLTQLEQHIPHIKKSMLNSMRNVQPCSLLDQDLNPELQTRDVRDIQTSTPA